MDHNEVVRQKMTEKYLLDELELEARDKFEEHFFDCPDCAFDVRAASELVAQSKVVLAEEPKKLRVPESSNLHGIGGGWFAWLRPSFAVPVMALLLAIIAYQNLVTYPAQRSALHQPQVLPWASINVGTWGANGPTITVPQGKGFLLFVRIPPDRPYTSYTAELHNPSGRVEWSLAIPASASQDQWPVEIPGANREAGTYTLAVRGITAAGESKDLGSTSFELRIQK